MRALLLILDGAGCGDATDAATFHDDGANTLGHVLARHPGLALPALHSLGLWKLLTADVFDPRSQGTAARWGRMRARSPGKDSLSGHWELAGVIRDRPFEVISSVSEVFAALLEKEAGTSFLGKAAPEGPPALETFGEEHLRTGRPIVFGAGDAGLEIAAHESVLPLARLHDLCRRVRRRASSAGVARIIARPFTGQPGTFTYLPGRRDYAIAPPRTILNAIAECGLPVEGVGKIGDLFAGSGITRSKPTRSNAEGMAEIERAWEVGNDGLTFANLADFDELAGHPRDPDAYARLLVEFDAWLGSFLPRIDRDDLVIVTADHGNDPTFPGAAHTRETVPLMVLHGDETGPLGARRTFADVAATLGDFFKLRQRWPMGESFLRISGRPARTKTR